MPKKNPLQDKSLRGESDVDNVSIAEKTYSGYIPPAAINALKWEAVGLLHGIATLTLHVRGGKLIRFVTGRERSFMGGNDE
jgi:hypothetical protein